MAITIHTTGLIDRRMTTLAAVKGIMDISSTVNDTNLNNLIDRASDTIISFTGRAYSKVELTETLQSVGRHKLLLSRRPIRSVIRVALESVDNTVGTSIPSTTFEIDSKEGGILFRSPVWTNTLIEKHFIEPIPTDIGRRDWRVRYTAGYVMPNSTAAATSTERLPFDLEHACIEIVKSWHLTRKADGLLKSQKIGDASESRFSASEGAAFGFSPAVISILNKWRELPLTV